MNNYKEVSEFVHKLTTTKLDCGQNIRELTHYQGVSLWWFAQFNLIEFLLKMPENESDFISKELRFQNYISALPYIFMKIANLSFDLTRKLFLKAALFIYRKKNISHGHISSKKILFTSQDLMWRQVKNYETKKMRKSDAFFDSLIKMSNEQKNFELISVYPFIKYVYPFKSIKKSVETLLEKLKSWNISHIPLNLFWDLKVDQNENLAAKNFHKKWGILKNDEKFKQICGFNQTDLYDLIYKKMKFFFLILFPYAVKRIEMASNLLKKQSPDLVLLINEYGIFERSLLIAAKNKSIPTLAMQHGNITPQHQGYMFHPEDISQDGSIRSPYCHLPDRTTLFGPYFKQILSDISAYPPESLTVIGNPRYDILVSIKRNYSKQDVLNEYGVNTNKKILLWTTQSIGLPDQENIANLKAISDLMDSNLPCTLIIKQHPREGDYYTRMINKHLCLPRQDIFLVPKMADTLLLIRACDVMITKFSTTAIEALALEKELLIMNFSGVPDKVGYVQEGVARGVYKPDELPRAVERILNNSCSLAQNRNAYIQKYLYKIDGKATSRVVSIIEDMLSKHKNEI